MNLERIKVHVRRHKDKYLLGTGILIGGVIVILTRRAIIQGSMNQSNMASFFIGKNLQNNWIVGVLEREGRGHPGYALECVEHGGRYVNQMDLAQNLGVSDWIVSRHVRGYAPYDIHGLHYRRIRPIAA